MAPGGVVLALDDEVRRTLRNLLAVSLELTSGARVVDHLPSNPWGDLDAFTRTAYEPLQGPRTAEDAGVDTFTEVALTGEDARLVGGVLRGLSESVSGGVPWSLLSEAERAAVTRVMAAL